MIMMMMMMFSYFSVDWKAVVIFMSTCADALIFLGGESIWRESEDQLKGGTIIIRPSEVFRENRGVLVGWNVYTTRGRRSQVVHMQVWRKLDNLSYERVGETSITALWVGNNYFLLHPDDRILISKGDVLGIYFPGYSPVPWSSVECTDSEDIHLYNYDSRRNNPVKFNRNISSNSPCRIYSLNATIMGEQEVQKFDIDYEEMRDGRYNRRPYGRYLTFNRGYDLSKATPSQQQLHDFLFVMLVIIHHLTSAIPI